jgi:hypothetical protein
MGEIRFERPDRGRQRPVMRSWLDAEVRCLDEELNAASGAALNDGRWRPRNNCQVRYGLIRQVSHRVSTHVCFL